MTGARSGLAQSVQARLIRHANSSGIEPNVALTRYALERFLYRLARSPHRERFVLKGALLMLAWLGETLRPTRDADLLGFGDLPDEALVEIFRETCAVVVEPDAMIFLPETLDLQPIREEDAYGGRRITLQARLGPARLILQVDIGLGDAVTPPAEWLDYPSLLDQPRPRLRAYPRETVVAEKLHAMVRFGMRNSRLKDYYDIRALLREGALDTVLLPRAIAATFERRKTALPRGIPSGLSDAFSGDPALRSRWDGFLKKNRLEGPTLPEVVSEVREGLKGAIEEARAMLTRP